MNSETWIGLVLVFIASVCVHYGAYGLATFFGLSAIDDMIARAIKPVVYNLKSKPQ
jgi:hypothetical protein